MSDNVQDLKALLGDAAVSFDADDLNLHARDWSPAALLAQRAGVDAAQPLCVVRPGSTEDVAKLLEWADRAKTPVVPFGGGSNVVRGIEPNAAIVVDMTRMNTIGEIDEKSLLVEVDAGVMGPELAVELAGAGFMLGHEPQSHDISSVGGWVATRASGQLSAGYGSIEDVVAGLEAVLPGGRIVRSKAVPRRSAGPDVASLMIGSEGTLGIVTSVTLRISHLPGPRADRCVRFEHMADGVAGAREIAQSGMRPLMLRLYDADDATLLLRNNPDEPPGPVMLMSFAGLHAEDRAKNAVHLAGGEEGTHALVDQWWRHRNDMTSEFRDLMAGEGLLGPHGVVESIEVAGTWTVLRELYHSVREALSKEADFVGCHLSHTYRDGACLYFSIGSVAESDDDAATKLQAWWDVTMRATLDAGGSISHHHGIGRQKAPWLEEELGGWFDVLKSVKAAIDPNGIMNPGALGL